MWRSSHRAIVVIPADMLILLTATMAILLKQCSMVSLSSIWNFPTVIHELQACFSTASAASDMRFVRRSKLVIRVQSQYSTPIASFFFVGLLKLFRSTFYCFFLHRRCPL